MDAAAVVEQLATPEARANPYPLYERARALGPVAPVNDTFVLVTGYEAADRVLREREFGVFDREVSASLWGDTPEPRSLGLLGRSILQSNQPAHTRMRGPIAAVFTPRRIAALEPVIARTVDRLLDEMGAIALGGAPVDFMEHFAFRLPVGVICALLGVAEADERRFRGPAHDLLTALEFMSVNLDLGPANAAAADLTDYFERLVAERRAHPREDLVSALVRLRDDNPETEITDAELIANLVLLLVAGFETTTNLLGNGLALLFAHDRVRTALTRGEPAVGLFVEEVLRYDSPVQLTSRIALREGLTVDGLALPRYGEVLLLIGAANRDPERFHEPQRFDPWRAETGSLSFGAGIHYCVGAMLARLEATVAFPRLLDRFPAMVSASGAVRHDRLLLRGYGVLPVVLND